MWQQRDMESFNVPGQTVSFPLLSNPMEVSRDATVTNTDVISPAQPPLQLPTDTVSSIRPSSIPTRTNVSNSHLITRQSDHIQNATSPQSPSPMQPPDEGLQSTTHSIARCFVCCLNFQNRRNANCRYSNHNKPMCYCCPQFSFRPLPNENLFILSTIQILCGVAAIILASVAVSSQLFLYQLGTGLWSGGLMLATGLLGIVTSKRKLICTLISLLVMCILAIIVSILLGAHSVIGFLVDGGIWEPRDSYYHGGYGILVSRYSDFYGPGGPMLTNNNAHVFVMHGLLLVVTILELSVAVTTASSLCRQICCGRVHYVSNRTIIVEERGRRHEAAPFPTPQSPLPAAGGNEFPFLIGSRVAALNRIPVSSSCPRVQQLLLPRDGRSQRVQTSTATFRVADNSLAFTLPSPRDEATSFLLSPLPPTYDESNLHFIRSTVVDISPPEYTTLDRRCPNTTTELSTQPDPDV